MKAIIFDCDGTLVDSEMLHYRAWAHALKKHGCDITLEDYYNCVGIPIDKASHIFAKKIGENYAEELKKDKYEHFKSLLREGIAPIEGTLAFLHKLLNEQKRLNYKLAIASGASHEEISLYLRSLNISDVFDLVLSGKEDLAHYNDPEGTNKPKPYIYLEAAKRLGINPSDCIVIEDSYTGVMSSSKAGCFTVAVPNSFSLNHDFSGSHLLISSFNTYSVDQFFKDVEANRHPDREQGPVHLV